MKENPYKRLPPIERKQDGSLYRMTPAQRKQANALIRRECCCYEDGNCMLLDDGDTHTCPQTISFSVCCKWFRWSVLPQIGTLEAEIFRDNSVRRRIKAYNTFASLDRGLNVGASKRKLDSRVKLTDFSG